MAIQSVAIIGAGAAGAAAAAALKAENHFKTIRVFERRGEAGGTWIYDADPGIIDFQPGALPTDIDPSLSIPQALPTTTPPNTQQRYHITPIYDELTTNVPQIAMSFSDSSFPYGPFCPHWIPRAHIEDYFSRYHVDSDIIFNTTVEDVSSIGHNRWRLTLRKYDGAAHVDHWWSEEFDGVIFANGHYSIPYVPPVKGLPQFKRKYPGRVEHSKSYRSPRLYTNKRVLVIGNSASGHDVAQQILESHLAEPPLYVSRRSRSRWDGDEPPPGVIWKPIISEYCLDGTIIFEDGTTLGDIDKIVYCTGYKPSFPFWNERTNGRPLYDYRHDRIINNYQHTFVHDFPTLALLGFPRVLTFRSFEYQAISIARLWANRAARPLPEISEQKLWFKQRAEETKAGGTKFHQIEWDYGETMDWFRYLFELAGLPLLEGFGRCPPTLGEETRWAIDHVKKYPEPGKGKSPLWKSDKGGSAEDWEMVEHKDSLHFI